MILVLIHIDAVTPRLFRANRGVMTLQGYFQTENGVKEEKKKALKVEDGMLPLPQ